MIQTVEWKAHETTSIRIEVEADDFLDDCTMDLTAEEFDTINRFVAALPQYEGFGPYFRFIFPENSIM